MMGFRLGVHSQVRAGRQGSGHHRGRKTRSQSKPSPAKPPVKRAGTMQKTAKEGKDYLKRGKGKGKGKKAADDGDKVEEKEEEEEEEKEEAKNDEEDGE